MNGSELVERIRQFVIKAYVPSETTIEQDQEQLKEIEQAKAKWQLAERMFHEAVDAEQVDIAIYSWSAAEKRYMYLLRKAKLNGLRAGLQINFKSNNTFKR